jgi:hypothetical protein
MRSWQIFIVGVAVVVAALLLPLYEPVVAGLGASAGVGLVAGGFLLHPRRDIFYVRTSVWRADLDGNLSLEHDQLAIKIELARLWLLFLPTALAMAFLVVTTAKGTLLRFSLLDMFFGEPRLVFLTILRFVLPVGVAALIAWVGERRVLRNADACTAESVTTGDGWVSFAFRDRHGEIYAGEGFNYGFVRPRELATLVFYDVMKPERNRIGMSFLFHRLIIVGRGLNDLDEQTIAAHTAAAQTMPS